MNLRKSISSLTTIAASALVSFAIQPTLAAQSGTDLGLQPKSDQQAMAHSLRLQQVLNQLQLLSAGPGMSKSSATADEITAQYYADKYAVSLEEAKWRLQLQESTGELNAILEQVDQQNFAGLYIEHHNDARIVARFKSTEMGIAQQLTQSATALYRPLLKINPSEYSLADLQSQEQQIFNKITLLGIEAETNIDIRSGKIKVYLDSKGLGKLASASVDKEANKVSSLTLAQNKIAGQMTNLEVILVSKLTQLKSLPDDNKSLAGRRLSDPTCTLGFGVRKGDMYGSVTAAHCIRNKPDVIQEDGNLTVGTGVAAFRYNGSEDYAVSTGSGIENTSWLKTSFAAATQVTGYKLRSEAVVGSFLCKTGRTTGTTCGNLDSKDFRPSTAPGGYKDASADWGVLTDIDYNNGSCVAVSAGGDSGSPIWSNGKAYGILHGGEYIYIDGVGTCDHTIFQFWDPIHNDGWELLTGSMTGSDEQICDKIDRVHYVFDASTSPLEQGKFLSAMDELEHYNYCIDFANGNTGDHWTIRLKPNSICHTEFVMDITNKVVKVPNGLGNCGVDFAKGVLLQMAGSDVRGPYVNQKDPRNHF